MILRGWRASSSDSHTVERTEAEAAPVVCMLSPFFVIASVFPLDHTQCFAFGDWTKLL